MKVNSNIVDTILDKCSVYPRQDKKLLKTINRIPMVTTVEEGQESSKREVVAKVSKAMDLGYPDLLRCCSIKPLC
jgi:hypothetical protein